MNADDRPAGGVPCTCPPTGRLLPHRKTCPRWRRKSSRAKSAQDRMKGNDRG